jgi:DNA-binding XRE family transcriptional regulator
MAAVMEKQRLADLRIDARFDTQQELAEAARVSKATIWLAENDRPISRKTARKIVNALRDRDLNVTIDDIEWLILE